MLAVLERGRRRSVGLKKVAGVVRGVQYRYYPLEVAKKVCKEVIAELIVSLEKDLAVYALTEEFKNM